MLFRSNITLDRRFEVEVAWTRGDPSLLERAMVNLLINAIKYSPEGTIVELVVETKGNELHAGVVDQGPGIPPAELPELFDRFRRGSAGGSSGTRGIGLGLAFVKAVADRHSGRVEATSAPDGGSRFTLVLPLNA